MAMYSDSVGNDSMTGSTDGDMLYGYSGNGSLNVGRGSDTIHGDDGNDVLIGGSGSGEDALLLGSSNVADAGNYSHSLGWTSQNLYPRQLGDANGDGRADIIAISSDNVLVGLAQPDGTFAAPVVADTGFAANDGWTSQNLYPRLVGDVNGDGWDELIAMGEPRSLAHPSS